MFNLIFPQLPPNPYEAQMKQMTEIFEQYREALEMIRDNSSDMTAVALASNVLMGIRTDFAFFVFPARPKHQNGHT